MRIARWVISILSLTWTIPTYSQGVDCQAILQELMSGMGGPGYGVPQRAEELANIYNTYCHGGQQQTPAPQQSICPSETSYCANSNQCCNVGSYCSHYGCTPNGAVECGTHYCDPGQQCSRSGGCQPAGSVDCGEYYCQPGQRCGSNHRACLNASDVDCGTYSCTAGNKCSSGGCIPQTATDCGNKSYCKDGLKCSRTGKSCLPSDAVDCGSHTCAAGMRCGSNNSCLAKDAVDCGGGRSCQAGTVCVSGGAECPTLKELSNRLAAEKQAQQEKAALQARLKQQASSQEKEDRNAAAWLEKEKAKLVLDQQLAAKRAIQADRESRLNAQRTAPTLCGQKTSCVMTIVQAASLSSTNQSTKLAPINATWTTTKTQVYTILSGTEQATVATSSLKPSGTPVQTITIGPIGKAVTVGTPVAIGHPISITSVLQGLGNSKIVQIGLNSAAAAGGDAAHLILSGGSLATANALGNLSDAANVLRAYQTQGSLFAAQTAAEIVTVKAGGALGAALAPEDPLLGKAVGTAVSERSRERWYIVRCSTNWRRVIQCGPGSLDAIDIRVIQFCSSMTDDFNWTSSLEHVPNTR